MLKNMTVDPRNLNGATGIIIGAVSGTMTGIAADADVFAIRNCTPAGGTPRALAISAIRSCFASTTGASADGSFALKFFKVLGFTAVHTGGTPKSILARYRRTPASAAQTATPAADANQQIPLTEIDTVISSTAALTSGTFTAVDADEPFDCAAMGGILAATTRVITMDHLWTPNDGLPIELLPDEGIVCKTMVAMPTALAGVMGITAQGFRF